MYAPAVEIFTVGVGVALKVVPIGHDQGGELGFYSLPKGCKRSVRTASAHPKHRAGPGAGPKAHKVRKVPLSSTLEYAKRLCVFTYHEVGEV